MIVGWELSKCFRHCEAPKDQRTVSLSRNVQGTAVCYRRLRIDNHGKMCLRLGTSLVISSSVASDMVCERGKRRHTGGWPSNTRVRRTRWRGRVKRTEKEEREKTKVRRSYMLKYNVMWLLVIDGCKMVCLPFLCSDRLFDWCC